MGGIVPVSSSLRLSASLLLKPLPSKMLTVATEAVCRIPELTSYQNMTSNIIYGIILTSRAPSCRSSLNVMLCKNVGFVLHLKIS